MPKRRYKRNTIVLKILDALQTAGPMTSPEIQAFANTTSNSTCAHIRKLMEKRLIHRSGWQRMVGRSGKEAAIYSPGPGRNVNRPNFKQASYERKLEWQREYRKKKSKMQKLQHMSDNPFRTLIVQLESS